MALESIRVFAFNYESSEPISGDAANITCVVSRDGAAPTALAMSHPVDEGSGYYRFSVDPSERAADNTLDFTAVSSTPKVVVIVPNFNRQVFGRELVDVQDLLKASRYIDQSSVPWREVLIKQGSGSLADGERLLVRELYTLEGQPVDSIRKFIASAITVT